MKRTVLLLSAACALLVPPSAAAQSGMRVIAVEGVRVDGAIGDWRGARFVDVGDGSDASMRFALGHDERGFYLAAEVRDERLVRTPRPGAREDAVILTVSTPGRGGAVDLYVFAGVSGRSAASVGMARTGSGRVRAVRGASAVEGPLRRGRGYTVEAFIPFSAIPNGSRWRDARGTIRLRDVDSEAHPEVESEPALVAVDALVPLRPASGGALEDFLEAQNLLASRPSHTLSGDVAGDRRPERVTLIAGYVVVSGPGFRDGRGYAYHQLAVRAARDVRSAELVDLTGDGKDELVVVLRQRNAQGERDLWRVLSLGGDSPRPLFGLEVRKAAGGNSVEARVRVRRSRRGPASIEVRAGRARGFDAASYRESPASDVEPMLLPWGPVRSRVYRWSGRGFERVSEQANPRYAPPRAERPSPGRPAPRPAAPRAPSTDDLLAAFRREQGISRRARPDHRMQANFVGGSGRGTGLVYGRKLVIVGPDIRGGTSWFYYEVPASSDADVLGVEAADVTGDGRAEVLVRVRQTFGDVTREVLLVHQLTRSGFPRLLQVEVARTQGRRSIRNRVSTRGGRLEIAPGRARGWSAESYNFTRDAGDPVAPLLLPWQDRALRYRLRGQTLVAR